MDLAPAFNAHGGDYNRYVLTDELVPTAFGPLPNDHPTIQGYSLIADQLAAAPVPEAPTALSFGLLLLGGLAVAFRRRKTRA